MKKLFFGLIASTLLAFNGNAQEITKLNTDNDFKTYLKNEFEFTKNSNPELVKKIDALTDEKQLSDFYKAFNTSEVAYTNHLNQQNRILVKIYNNYSFNTINDEKLKELLAIEISEVINADDYYTAIVQGGTNCRRKYHNALAINLSTAVVAHLGCTTLDLALIPGLICHAAVGLGHAAANDQAYLDYLDCINN